VVQEFPQSKQEARLQKRGQGLPAAYQNQAPERIPPCDDGRMSSHGVKLCVSAENWAPALLND
jgi:hypothetical protein